MTIYKLFIDSSSLNKLPSNAYVIELCTLISKYLVTHFVNLDLQDNNLAPKHLYTLFMILRNFLRMLKKSSRRRRSESELPIFIRQIHLNCIATDSTPEINHVVDPSALREIPTDLLVKLLYKMINESLNCVVPHCRTMPEMDLECCVDVLRAIPGGIEKILRENIESFTSANQYNLNTEHLVVKLTIGIQDHIREVVLLRI